MKKIQQIGTIVALTLLACAGPVRLQVDAPRPLSKSSAKLLIQEARKHLGEPYRYGGISSKGWDCSGFVMTMYHESLNIILPHKSAEMFEQGFPLAVSCAKPGDMIFFKPRHGKPSHVGIYIGKRRFIHATKSGGVMISSLDDEYYIQRFIGIRRINFQIVAAAQ
jgi:cell wall-associated NlpC family hydrolase